MRDSPRRARGAGPAFVTSWPSIDTRPDLGASSPLTTLNNVVLPAPFGPISPVTPAWATVEGDVAEDLGPTEGHADLRDLKNGHRPPPPPVARRWPARGTAVLSRARCRLTGSSEGLGLAPAVPPPAARWR